MSLEEVFEENPRISKAQVERTLKSHGETMAEFEKTFGAHESYQGAAVLIWLGY